MLFSVSLGESQSAENFTISGNTWSECLAYCEGTGKKINSIILLEGNLMANNISLNYCFVVGLLHNTTSNREVFQIFDTESNVLNWIISQSDKSLTSLTKQNKQFVTI